jgi:hypothetical protein
VTKLSVTFVRFSLRRFFTTSEHLRNVNIHCTELPQVHGLICAATSDRDSFIVAQVI